MLASPGDLPLSDDRSWSYEVKWDGMRVLATSSAGGLRLTSRTGNDVSGRFPELVEAVPQGLRPGSVLDGEVVLFDAAGRPSFGLLAPRIQRNATTAVLRPVTFLVFDILRLGITEVMDRPYDERRRLLEDAVDVSPRVVVPGAFDDGAGLFASTVEQGLEGVIAKRRTSRYQPGVRSSDWVKVPHRSTRSHVVGGWKSRTDSPTRLASLLVGSPTGDGMLRWDGAVGSGLSEPEVAAVLGVLREIEVETSPFHAYPAPEPSREHVLHWVEPVLVVDVEHLGRTSNGLLRQPTIARIRPDLSPDDVEKGAEA